MSGFLLFQRLAFEITSVLVTIGYLEMQIQDGVKDEGRMGSSRAGENKSEGTAL